MGWAVELTEILVDAGPLIAGFDDADVWHAPWRGGGGRTRTRPPTAHSAARALIEYLWPTACRVGPPRSPGKRLEACSPPLWLDSSRRPARAVESGEAFGRASPAVAGRGSSAQWAVLLESARCCRGTWRSLLTIGVLLDALTACAPTTTPTAAAPPTDASPTAKLPPAVTAQIDQLAAAVLGNGITGAIVSVADPAHGTHLKAYGAADAAGTPMTVDIHYRIASVSKTFTAHAVLELAGQGKLSLDDPWRGSCRTSPR